jgi:hypothetical protein
MGHGGKRRGAGRKPGPAAPLLTPLTVADIADMALDAADLDAMRIENLADLALDDAAAVLFGLKIEERQKTGVKRHPGRPKDVLAALRDRGPDGNWIAHLAEAYLAGGKPLQELLSTDPRPGTGLRYQQRDAALGALSEVFEGISIAGAVREVRRLCRRYQIRWDRVDKHRAEMPPAYAGTPEEHLFAAFSAGGGKVPLSRTRLRKIISNQQVRRSIAKEPT